MKTATFLAWALALILGLLTAALAQPDAPAGPLAVQPEQIDTLTGAGDGWRIGKLEGYWQTSLASDVQGRPHFSYNISQGGASLLGHSYLDQDGWHKETVPGTDHVEETLITLSAGGEPHILFDQVDASSELRYAYRDASGWHVESVASQTGVASNRSTALDASGGVHICFVDDATGQLMAGYRNTLGWTLSPIDAQSHAGQRCSLALDGQGQPRIAYVDAASASLKLASRDDAGWHVEAVDSASDGSVSLAVDGAGYVHIGYAWEQAAKYAHRDVYGWHTEVVATVTYGDRNAVGVGRCCLRPTADGRQLHVFGAATLPAGVRPLSPNVL